jgi:glycosyltransferase involved in cell wall biosynthesis
MPLSVAIITLNETDRIKDCLKTVSFADEILVVDSGSRDDTVKIAESFGCKIFFQEWLGYSRQKQYAVDKCSNDMVLILDADERLPKETGEGIQRIISMPEPEIVSYRFLRKNIFHGRWIRHCGWWPDRVVRLVNRRQGNFNDNLVHEGWISHGAVKNLDLCIEHYSFRHYADMIKKMQDYSTLAAQEMLQKGIHATCWTPFSHGLWMFIRTYFFERGLLEGFDGLMISLLNAGGSLMKYAKLRELEKYGDSSSSNL